MFVFKLGVYSSLIFYFCSGYLEGFREKYDVDSEINDYEQKENEISRDVPKFTQNRQLLIPDSKVIEEESKIGENFENKSIKIQKRGRLQLCRSLNDTFVGQPNPHYSKIEYCPENVAIVNGIMELTLTPKCGTTVIYNVPFTLGKIEARIKMASGSGAVTAFVMLGEGLRRDEIDIEFVGLDLLNMQSMYYVGGNKVDQTSQFHTKNIDLSLDFHNYAIELLEDRVNWFIDGEIVRTLYKNSESTFPENAGRTTRIGIWDGSKTHGWAGTSDFSDGNKKMYVEWVSIKKYCDFGKYPF
ncbi:putative glycosidase CRH1 [Smittium culicis]|uniref:Putative glycosidase CRH1 n=1 Tax=Smittium culicis TaxID=133412 RepID=A0A1R1Y732_9FUNG|nr:putative glycosidase CRH1 [Smittium culicis]